MSYLDLFIEQDDLVAENGEQNLFAYQELLQKYVDKKEPVNLLAIGVKNGGSLQLWKKFLPEGSQVYGVDLLQKCKKVEYGENIHFTLGDASTPDFWDENFKDIKFDIIVENGSHLCNEVINTFEFSFVHKLNMGGTYIAEGLQASYSMGYQGGYKTKNSSIEYFKNLIDYLNFNYIELPADFDRTQLNPLKELHEHIKKVSFYDSICAVEKYSKQLEGPFNKYFTGTNAPVFADENLEEQKIQNRMDEINKTKQHFE